MAIGSNASNTSGDKSDISYLSGLSNVTGLSGMSGNTKGCCSPFSPIDKERILEEDIVGSEHYISPEMLSHRESYYASDLWAFGVIIYQMLTE